MFRVLLLLLFLLFCHIFSSSHPHYQLGALAIFLANFWVIWGIFGCFLEFIFSFFVFILGLFWYISVHFGTFWYILGVQTFGKSKFFGIQNVWGSNFLSVSRNWRVKICRLSYFWGLNKFRGVKKNWGVNIFGGFKFVRVNILGGRISLGSKNFEDWKFFGSKCMGGKTFGFTNFGRLY